MLIPVVPADARIVALASMAAILAPSGDLYTKKMKPGFMAASSSVTSMGLPLEPRLRGSQNWFADYI